MTNSYTFGGGSKGDTSRSFTDVLPEGDYSFTVLECGEPYVNPKGRWVLKVTISIPPNDHWVWAAPWSGETDAGEERDGIGDFLLSCGRGTAIGKIPDYKRVIGAKGKCQLKIGKNLEGKARNEVARFYTPKQVGPSAEQQPRQSYSSDEVNKVAKPAKESAGGDDIEPDDIPF